MTKPQNASEAAKAFTEAGIPFIEEQFLCNFWGTRFIFKTRKHAQAAEKIVGPHVLRHYKQWAVEYF